MSDLKKLLALSESDIAALPYESARELLTTVVDALDDSTLPLSDLMKLWEIGEKITAVCEAHLAAAAEKLADGLPAADN
ncbi:MAG: Exonuclease small subunit [Actinomycetota bacterium]